MLAGPIFSRETATASRQLRHYLIRSGYVAALFVLMYTAGQAVFGWQQVRNIGDIAHFGSLVFGIFSLVQLVLVLFFALLFLAGGGAGFGTQTSRFLVANSSASASRQLLPPPKTISSWPFVACAAAVLCQLV